MPHSDKLRRQNTGYARSKGDKTKEARMSEMKIV